MSDIRAVFMGQFSVDVSGMSDCFRPRTAGDDMHKITESYQPVAYPGSSQESLLNTFAIWTEPSFGLMVSTGFAEPLYLMYNDSAIKGAFALGA